MPRLNDTAALAARKNGAEEHSISCREIDNGFIVRKSACNPETGEYRSSERFYSRAPTIMEPRVTRGPRPDGEGQGLRDTMDYLNKR